MSRNVCLSSVDFQAFVDGTVSLVPEKVDAKKINGNVPHMNANPSVDISATLEQNINTANFSNSSVSTNLSSRLKEQVISSQVTIQSRRTAATNRGSLKPLMPKYSKVSVFTHKQIENISVDTINSVSNTRSPNTIQSSKLGVYTKNDLCETCNIHDCPGHYGILPLTLVKNSLKATEVEEEDPKKKGPKPKDSFIAYNPSFIRIIVSILISVCNECGCLLVPEHYLQTSGILNLKYEKRLAEIESIAKTAKCMSTFNSSKQRSIKVGDKTYDITNNELWTNTSGIFGLEEINNNRNLIEAIKELKKFVEEHRFNMGGGYIKACFILMEAAVNSGKEDITWEQTWNMVANIFENMGVLPLPAKKDTKEGKKSKDVDIVKKNHFPESYRTIINLEGYIKIAKTNGLFWAIKRYYDRFPTNTKYLERRIASDVTGVNAQYTVFDQEALNDPKIRSIIPTNIDIKVCAVNNIYATNDIDNKHTIVVYNRSSKEKNKKTASPVKIDDIEKIFNAISDETFKLMGFGDVESPRGFLLRSLIVIPEISRMPSYVNGVNARDKLDNLYLSIVSKLSDSNTSYTSELINKTVYEEMKKYITSDGSNERDLGDFPTIKNRIQGKEALIRENLMGKRGNHSARTVASGNIMMDFDGIGVPEVWKTIITKNIMLSTYNKDYIKQLKEDGKLVRIRYRRGREIAFKKHMSKVKDGEFNKILKYNKPGSVIFERELQDDDGIVANRQPSLHKFSMMRFSAKVHEHYVLKIHPYATSPLNADFDGDELNIWNPQDQEVETEGYLIMNIIHNIISNHQSKPIIGVIMNSLTSLYTMTYPYHPNSKGAGEVQFSSQFIRMFISKLSRNDDRLESIRARINKYSLRGVKYNNPKGLLSLIFPKDFYFRHNGNRDGNVVEIIEGIYVSGTLRKTTLGTGDSSIVQALYHKYGGREVKKFFTEIGILASLFLQEYGYSFGLDDCEMREVAAEGKGQVSKLTKLKMEIKRASKEVEKLSQIPTNTVLEKENIENQIINTINIAESLGRELASNALTNNRIGNMTEKGSEAKGTPFNVGQIFVSVGQQIMRNKRLRRMMTQDTRILSNFDVGENHPRNNGFVESSYYEGLKPSELFFIQTAGREGTTDTALKTAETGDIERKMVKAMENIISSNKYAITNVMGEMFSTTYNGGYKIEGTVRIPGADIGANASMFANVKEIMKEAIELTKAKFNEEEVNSDQGYEMVMEIASTDPKPPSVIDNYENSLDLIRKNRNNDIITAEMSEKAYGKLSIYEKARIVATRACLIELGQPILITEDEYKDIVDKPYLIALKEYELGRLVDMGVRRFVNNTSKFVLANLDNIM